MWNTLSKVTELLQSIVMLWLVIDVWRLKDARERDEQAKD